MEFSDFAAALKYVSIAVTALLGALGLVKDTRDRETHELTRWGKYALAGIVISSLLSTAIQTFEVIQARREQKAAALRRIDELTQQRLLIESTGRAANPFSGQIVVGGFLRVQSRRTDARWLDDEIRRNPVALNPALSELLSKVTCSIYIRKGDGAFRAHDAVFSLPPLQAVPLEKALFENDETHFAAAFRDTDPQMARVIFRAATRPIKNHNMLSLLDFASANVSVKCTDEGNEIVVIPRSLTLEDAKHHARIQVEGFLHRVTDDSFATDLPADVNFGATRGWR